MLWTRQRPRHRDVSFGLDRGGVRRGRHAACAPIIARGLLKVSRRETRQLSRHQFSGNNDAALPDERPGARVLDPPKIT